MNQSQATTKKETPTQEVSLATSLPNNIMPVNSFDPQLQIEQAAKAANALVSVLKPIKVGNKDYFQFEHWQTIAKFYGHTVGVEYSRPIMKADKLWGYEAKSSVYHQGQLVGGAEAICTKDEKNWATRDEYALKSMAQTRAMAKGLRSIFGFVAVLAGVDPTPREEVPDGGFEDHKPSPAVQAVERRYAPSDKQIGMIKSLMEQKGYTAQDLVDLGYGLLDGLTGGKGGTASELIDFLLKAQPKIKQSNGEPYLDEDARDYMAS